MNTDDTITLVEKYFDNELTDSEAALFRDRLETDPSFRSLVEQEKILIQTIRHQGLVSDLAYLKTVEKTIGRGKSAKILTFKPWYYAAAAVVVLTLIAFWWLSVPSESPDKLFEAYFKPYPNVFEPTVRSSDAPADVRRAEAFVAYEQGDYQKAVALFTPLVNEKPEPGILLLLGNANLMLGKTDEAERNFTTLNKDFDELDLQAKWYLSLCYLKSGDVENARTILRELGETEISYAAKAKELLEKVN